MEALWTQASVGSRLHADHPANGVFIPRRNTHLFGPSITTISRVLTMKRTQIICSTGICATVARYFAPVSRKAKRKEAAQVSAMAKGLEFGEWAFLHKTPLECATEGFGRFPL